MCLQLHALAYNLGNFLRTLALPDEVGHWSLTTLREKLIKIGAKVVRHGRYMTFQLGPGRPPGQVCAVRAAVRSHSAKKSPAGLSIAKSARRRGEIAMQTAGSGPKLMSTALFATLPVAASGHLWNLR